MKLFRQFDIRWAEPVGLPECPYMVRWVLVLFGYSIRLHHWLASDDQRYPHDHAWDYISIILRGCYWEVTEGSGYAQRSAGSVQHYKAEHCHKVWIASPCWSLLFTGRPRRNWGFYVPGRTNMLRPLRYFSRYGHHPCE